MRNTLIPINLATGVTPMGMSRFGAFGPGIGGAPDDNGGGGGGGNDNNANGGGNNNSGGGGNGGGGNNSGGGDGSGGNSGGGSNSGGNNGGGGNNNSGGGGGGGEQTKSYTEAQLNSMFQDRLARDRRERGVTEFDTYKASHEELQQLKDKDLPEADRLRRDNEQKDATIASVTAERDAANLTSLRLTVAAEKNVPLTSAARLQGTTREELEADADMFLAETNVGGAGGVGGGRPLPNFQQGGGGTPNGGSTAAGRERYKQRNGK